MNPKLNKKSGFGMLIFVLIMSAFLSFLIANDSVEDWILRNYTTRTEIHTQDYFDAQSAENLSKLQELL